MKNRIIHCFAVLLSFFMIVSLVSASVTAAGTSTIHDVYLEGNFDPQEGDAPSSMTTDTYGVYIDYTDWCTSDWVLMNPHTDVFEAGQAYTMEVYMTSEPGYEFANEVQVHLHDKVITVFSEDSNSSLNLFYETIVDYGPQPLTNVRLQGLAPAQEGYTPDFTVMIPQEALYSVTDSYWQDSTGNYIWGDQTFNSGESYTHVIRLLPHQGYEFMKGGVIVDFGNDRVETIAPTDGALIVQDSYYLKKPEYIKITSVGLNSPVNPREGNKPDFTTSLLESECTISQTVWMDKNNKEISPQDTFKGGETYYRMVVLSANAGYQFNDPVRVRFGSGQAFETYPDPYSDHNDVLNVYQTFTAEKKPEIKQINTLTIKDIITPKAKQTPSTGFSFEGTPSVSITSNTWRDEQGKEIKATAAFEAGHSYERHFSIEAVNGTQFAPNVKVIIDGETQTVSAKNNTIEVSRWYKINEEKHVHKLTLVKGVEPTVDKMGSKSYYQCTCGKYFEDAEAKKEIKENIKKWKLIPPLKPQEENKPSATARPSKEQILWSDSSQAPVIKVPGDLSSLKEVQLDGKKLDPKDYTVESSTALITFSKDILSALQNGEHTITFVYPENKIDQTLAVTLPVQTPEASPEPQKQSSGSFGWIIACIIGLCTGAAVTLFLNKKKQK